MTEPTKPAMCHILVPLESYKVTEENLPDLCKQFKLDPAGVLIGGYITVQYIGGSTLGKIMDSYTGVADAEVANNAQLVRVWREDLFLKYHRLKE